MVAVESLVESTSAAQCVAERNGDGLEGKVKRGCRKEVGVSGLH